MNDQNPNTKPTEISSSLVVQSETPRELGDEPKTPLPWIPHHPAGGREVYANAETKTPMGSFVEEEDCWYAIRAANELPKLKADLTVANQALAASIEERRVLSELFTTKLAESQQREAGLREAASIGAKWMEWWIAQSECDCEMHHNCGLPERRRELEQIQQALTSPTTSVVPWEVVQNYLDKLEWRNSTAKVAMANSDALNSANAQLSKAWSKLLTYAPQPKEKQV